MKLCPTLLLLTSAMLCLPLAQAAPVPQFAHYPAQVYTGKNAALKLNADTRSFRTRFRALAQEKPNFAGHYAIGYAGCGTGCIIAMMVDVKSGASQFVSALNDCPPKNDGDEWRDKDINFQTNSRLMVLTGVTEEGGDAPSVCRREYWLEQNGKLKRIHSDIL